MIEQALTKVYEAIDLMFRNALKNDVPEECGLAYEHLEEAARLLNQIV